MAQTIEQSVDTQRSPSRSRILLVEERSDMRQYLTRLLSEYYEIEAAAEASTALNLAHERTPNLIVANTQMRPLGDFDLLLRFCGSTWGKVPIVLYSTDSNENTGVNAIEAEA